LCHGPTVARPVTSIDGISDRVIISCFGLIINLGVGDVA
jgi:hypothetical protein